MMKKVQYVAIVAIALLTAGAMTSCKPKQSAYKAVTVSYTHLDVYKRQGLTIS